MTADDRKLRNPAEALVLARRAVKASPEQDPHFLDTLAEALVQNGYREEALSTETQALKLDPKNTDLQIHLSKIRDAVRLTSRKQLSNKE